MQIEKDKCLEPSCSPEVNDAAGAPRLNPGCLLHGTLLFRSVKTVETVSENMSQKYIIYITEAN